MAAGTRGPRLNGRVHLSLPIGLEKRASNEWKRLVLHEFLRMAKGDDFFKELQGLIKGLGGHERISLCR